ncbi:MAG: nucleotidyltransferase domain-containing protein [bacterium]
MATNIKIFTDNEQKAIKEFKSELLKLFPDAEIILFGSKARGDFDVYSDIDLLILLNIPVTNKIEEKIVSVSGDIELKYDVVFGRLIENKQMWYSPKYQAMPIAENINKEGIAL